MSLILSYEDMSLVLSRSRGTRTKPWEHVTVTLEDADRPPSATLTISLNRADAAAMVRFLRSALDE